LGLLWAGAGLGLWHRSWVYLNDPLFNYSLLGVVTLSTVLIAWGKSKYVLDIAAHKAILRAAKNPYAHPVNIVSLRWITIIGIMSCLGFALRTLPYDTSIKTFLIGSVYPGIGSALIWSSLILLGHRNHQDPRLGMSVKARLSSGVGIKPPRLQDELQQ
jgi:hypothetical protein